MNDPIAAVVIIAIIAVLAYAFARKRKPSKPAKSGWHIMWSPGMPERPTPAGEGWRFAFPSGPASHVHYVQNFSPPPLRVGQSIKVRYRITGEGFVPQEFPDRVATMGLLIQRKGDNWSAEGEYASYRWYSSQTVPLEAGEFTLSVPLDILDWGPVQGTKSLHLFNQALKHVESIGFTFGSAGGRGHGVHGSGRFTLLWMEVS